MIIFHIWKDSWILLQGNKALSSINKALGEIWVLLSEPAFSPKCLGWQHSHEMVLQIILLKTNDKPSTTVAPIR